MVQRKVLVRGATNQALDELDATDIPALGYDATGSAAAAQAASQPLDSDLTAIAALTTTSYGRALLALADAAAGRTAFGLGTAATHATGDYDAAGAAAAAQAASQPLDSDLTAIAALTTTTYGRSLLEAANAAALRTLGGLVIGTDVAAPSSIAGHAIYGDGSDGAVTFATTGADKAFATRSGVTWTLTRDVYASSITIDATVIVVAGYRIFCTGTLTNNGTIQRNGNAGSTSNGGAVLAVAGLGGGTAGGAGVASGTTTAAGTNGIVTAGSDQGGAGGNGGNGNGGTGAAISPSALVPGVRDPSVALLSAYIVPNATIGNAPTIQKLHGGSGGGGGGRTAGTTATVAGGGGGGGGVVLVVSKAIDNTNGTISANGGAGANASGAGDCVTGGGGGGGGGWVTLIYDTLVAGIETATGGTKGSALNGAAAAQDGAVGKVVKIVNV